MKISVCGKRGSGKSLIVSLMATEMQSKGYKVLVVDMTLKYLRLV
jgi:CO dehydrogenase nickel-insertion accessory protein CooC1